MFFYSDDPVRDAERYAEALDRRLGSLPVCAVCHEAVQDEFGYQIHGKPVCARCRRYAHRARTRRLADKRAGR